MIVQKMRYLNASKPEALSLLLVLVILLLSGCSSREISKGKQTSTIHLEKTGCLNKCKAYNVSVSSDGKGTYRGQANVSKIGSYTRQLSKTENEDLWNLVNADTLLKLEGSYNYGDEDTQQQFLKYYSGGKLIKEIRYGPFPPDYLLKLDKALELISEAGDWEKSR